MRETNSGGIPSVETLLKVLQIAVAGSLLCLVALYVKGRGWAREASLLPSLAVEAQRNDLALRSMLYEAYQWNQTQRNPELSDLFRRLNFSVQTQATANPPPNPGGPVPAKPPGR